MTKWEYCFLTAIPKDGYVFFANENGGRIVLWSQLPINLEGYLPSPVHLSYNDEASIKMSIVAAYLGDAGWEAYQHGTFTWHLKRPIS